VGDSPKVLSGLASILNSGSPRKNAAGSALLRSSSRDSWGVKDNDFEHHSYLTAKFKKTALTLMDSPSPRRKTKHKRTVSWTDQITDGSTKSPSPSSDVEQSTHGSDDEQVPQSYREANTENSNSTGSTLSLNSSFNSNDNLTRLSPTPQALEDPTLAASRDFSPFKGKPLWDPDDDEWADVDANRIAETFKASFKDPGQYSPRKAGALSRWGSTATSYLPPFFPTKRAETQKLKEEEEVRDKLEILGNTYFCDPNGDLCDTVMKAVHLTGSAYFDNRTSARSSHVIDLEAYFNSPDAFLQAAKPRLCDAIAVILSHTNKECLEAFLDPKVGEFVYRRELERSKAGSILVVRRKGNSVIVGPLITSNV
jgi:hypothetical protein